MTDWKQEDRVLIFWVLVFAAIVIAMTFHAIPPSRTNWEEVPIVVVTPVG